VEDNSKMPDLDSLVLLGPLAIVIIAVAAIWLGMRRLPENPRRRRHRS
jgi:hypothetical protein